MTRLEALAALAIMAVVCVGMLIGCVALAMGRFEITALAMSGSLGIVFAAIAVVAIKELVGIVRE